MGHPTGVPMSHVDFFFWLKRGKKALLHIFVPYFPIVPCQIKGMSHGMLVYFPSSCRCFSGQVSSVDFRKLSVRPVLFRGLGS